MPGRGAVMTRAQSETSRFHVVLPKCGKRQAAYALASKQILHGVHARGSTQQQPAASAPWTPGSAARLAVVGPAERSCGEPYRMSPRPPAPQRSS